MRSLAILLIGTSLAHAQERPAEQPADRPQARPTGPAATPPDPLVVVTFDRGSTRLAEDAALEGAVRWQLDHPTRLLLIEGHADRTGSRSANLRLSQQRADAVRDALVRAGADPTRLVVSAHGEAEPSGDLAASRRVVIRGTADAYAELVREQREEERIDRELDPRRLDREHEREQRLELERRAAQRR